MIKKHLTTAWTRMLVSLGQGRAVAPFVIAAITATVSVMPTQASAETRSLKLYYVHTGEKAEIPFKKNGRFLPEGLKKLNVFLRDWRRNEPTKMDPRLFDLVWQVYKSTGSSQYITVVSAYRSPATNNMLRSKTSGVAKNSQHPLGRAMDFFIPGVPTAKLRAIGMRYQVGGVGYYPRSGSPFVHMDVGNVRSWPRMSRKELLALFPDGKTAHLPSDGKPLPGYQQALAMIEKRKASGGTVMMASNAAPRKSKTLFSALFGGGADEEEDVNDSTVAPATRPARVRAPERAPQETMVASLPTRDAPLPMQAPRSEPAVEVAPQAVEREVPIAALAVPIPSHKPVTAAQDAIALLASQPADLVAEQIAEADVSSPMLTGYVPVPSSRPMHDTGRDAGTVELAAAVIPSARPDNRTQSSADAIAELVNAQDNKVVAENPAPIAAPHAGTQLAMVSRKDEIGELIAPPQDDYDIAAAVPNARTPVPGPSPVRSGSVAKAASSKGAVQLASLNSSIGHEVRTTTKGARRLAQAPVKPRAVVKPAVMPASDVALSVASVSDAVPVTNPVLRNDALRAAPTVVYTAGFEQGDLPNGRANQFSGNAVTFLTVAKFSEIN